MIRILPEILSNKIAAGEVVERPASVVKELVENALDAESTRIVIEVEKGGRSLIRVSDNGGGMLHDDALLAIERYATSKIYRNEDLFAIKTLGFRGEALPSIAAVSRFSLVTRDARTDAGTEITIEGGRIKKVSAIGAPVGTMVSVKQLFFNTPARRKFLKGIQTEMGHITDVMAGLALGKPEVQFRLLHNDRPLKNWIIVSEPSDRVIDVLGRDLKNNLHHIHYDDEYLSLEGWLSSPMMTRKTSRSLYLYVNGRLVRDRVIQHAVFEGYAGKIVKGQFPIAVLFVRVPFERVDVNVHPAKNEIRFQDQKQVHDTVRQAVQKTLQQVERSRWVVSKRSEDGDSVSERKIPNAHFARPQHTVSESEKRAFFAGRHSQSGIRTGVPIYEFEKKHAQQGLWLQGRFKDLKIIGQFQDIYIVCEAKEDLILIDQHAAHERITYERLKNSMNNKMEMQGLLIPETIELGYREARTFEKFRPQLKELGFETEHFGGETYVVKSVPAILKDSEIKPLIIEILEKWIENGSDTIAEEAIDDCIKLMACHGSIRANQRLSDQETHAMLEQLDACQQPSNCPHGRPTWIKLSKGFLEKAFKRRV
jgi:DNA mismatch repair protein MutL